MRDYTDEEICQNHLPFFDDFVLTLAKQLVSYSLKFGQFLAATLVNTMNFKRTCRCFIAKFKAEVALAALTEWQPLAELATRYQLSIAQISRWKLQLRQQAVHLFARGLACLLKTTPRLNA